MGLASQMSKISAGRDHLRQGIGPAGESRLLAWLAVLLLTVAALLHDSGEAVAESRMALVIGNGGYSYAALANPVNDATDVAAALRDAGFEVTFKKDADQQTMDDAIHQFADTLKTKGGVGLFYFSGHGVQAAGENYLLPIGEAPSREADLKYKAVNAGEVIDGMAAAGNNLNIVILDACRNNPLAAGSRSATRGLSRVEGGAGMFVSFSTSPGGVALDGDGRNSPYTKHLVQAIRTRGLSLEAVFKETLKGVYKETDGKQVPWISSSFFGDFAFNPGGSNGPGGKSGAAEPSPQTSDATPHAPVRPAHPPDLAGIYHASGTNPNGSRYFGMTSIVATGSGYDVTWWIGKQLFHGTGHLAGRMLVVEWGDAHPVIYPISNANVLAGEWADGTATETLERFAAAAADPVASLAGNYRAAGRNPDGSRYNGSVAIREEGSAYRLSWQVGRTAYKGVGSLSGNVLVVDWGSSTPVVYAVADDGTLKGLWEGGKGEETLTPVH
jgi:hypothetical protein